MTIKVIMRKNRMRPDGTVQLHIRITMNRRHVYRTVGIAILPQHWDASSSKIKPSHPNSARINYLITEKLLEVQKVLINLQINGKLDADIIRDVLTSPETPSLIEYFRRYVDGLERHAPVGTFVKGKTVFRKLLIYQNDRDLNFDQVTPKWLQSYENYLRNEQSIKLINQSVS